MARPRKEVTEERKQRIPFGVQRRSLNVDEETMSYLRKHKKVARWINDEDHGMRIKRAMEGGYEYVSAEGTKVGDIKEIQDSARHIRKKVGIHRDGQPKYAYLMAIPEVFYNEDKRRKEEENMKVDEAIRGGTPPGLSNHGVSPAHGSTSIKNVDYKP